MTIDDQIKDEKLNYDINREAAKISALSLGYEYYTGEYILNKIRQIVSSLYQSKETSKVYNSIIKSLQM